MASPAMLVKPGPNALTLGRWEWVGDIQVPTAGNAALTLPTGGGVMPNDRFAHSYMLHFQGRLTNPGSGNPTGICADAPYTLIDRIIFTGYHRGRGQTEQFINVRGVQAYNYATQIQGRAPLSTGVLDISASAAVDLDFYIPIPFVPLGIRPHQMINWLLDLPNYDNPQLIIQFADPTNVYTGQTNPVVMSAYGSSTGNPVISVSAIYAMNGPNAFRGFIPGRVWRYFRENTAQLSASASQVTLDLVPRGYRIRGVLGTVGVINTASPAGARSFVSLSNTILANYNIQVGVNRNIRQFRQFEDSQEQPAEIYKQILPVGNNWVDFCLNQTDAEAWDLSQAIAGPTGDTLAQIVADVTGASNQAWEGMYEELRGTAVQG
jgi:hypothetical protein